MRRTNIHLTDRQLARLKALVADGLSVAELIRRAIDAYLEREEAKSRGKHGSR